MGFRSANELYSGQDLRTQLMYAEREVIELEKETKKLRDEKSFLEFRVELLEKQIAQLLESRDNVMDLYVDEGKYHALKHAENILNLNERKKR